MLKTPMKIAVFGLCLASIAPSWAESNRLSDIHWLAGHWMGIGDDGKTQGQALSVFTPPAQAAMSWTFRWHMPAEQHVHFAFSVFEETDNGVFFRGIHHGKDYQAFEDAPWLFVLTKANETQAHFRCLENCRAPGVNFKQLPDGTLLETWEVSKSNTEPFTVTYKRAP
ncbi:MAG: DUF6265 family protein [Pseudomonadota bacterium]